MEYIYPTRIFEIVVFSAGALGPELDRWLEFEAVVINLYIASGSLPGLIFLIW